MMGGSGVVNPTLSTLCGCGYKTGVIRLCPSKGIVRLGCLCGTYIGGNTHIYDGGKWCSEPYAFHALWVWLQDRVIRLCLSKGQF